MMIRERRLEHLVGTGFRWFLLYTLALLLAVFAIHEARSAVTGEWRVNLLRSSSTIETMKGPTAAVLDACVTKANALTTATHIAHKCQTLVYTTAWTADPPPTCPPKPADQTQPGSCPAGSTGAWTQTLTYTSAPAPACWTAGTWTPAGPPAGACTVTPPMPTTPTAVLICTGNAPFNQLYAACTTASLGQPTNSQAVLYCSDSVTPGTVRETCPNATWYNWGGIQGFSVVLTNAGWYARSAIQGVPQPLTAPVLTSTRTANATNPANSNVTLTWPAVPGATAGYDVERCSGPTCINFTALAAVAGLTYANTGLPGPQTLRYRVRGADAAGKGPYSNIETVIVPVAPVAGAGSASLTWTPPTTNEPIPPATVGTPLTNLSGYRIFYSPMGIAGPTLDQQVDVTGAAVKTYVVSGLAPGEWAFAVAARTSSGGISGKSDIATKVVPQ